MPAITIHVESSRILVFEFSVDVIRVSVKNLVNGNAAVGNEQCGKDSKGILQGFLCLFALFLVVFTKYLYNLDFSYFFCRYFYLPFNKYIKLYFMMFMTERATCL